MPAIFLYLVKLSCSLGLIWLFYRLVLRSLTFYTLNRWYLLGYTFLAFLIPFINIGPIRGEDPALQPVIIQYIPVIGNPIPPATAVTAATRATPWDAWSGLLLLLSLGSCFLLLRFLVRCYSLRALRRRAILLQKGPINIYRVQEPVSPFSFGNAIYISASEYSEKEWEEIILHEYVHIHQRHTLDILFGELLVIVNWFNPFAWLIRYSIRQNLEFIADRAVLETGRDKKGYQYHLLKVVGQTRYKLANNFNFSSLKKRIIMMNKMKSTRLHLLRFLFILPLLAILLVAFRDRIATFQSGNHIFVNAAGIVIDLPDRTPIAGVTVIEKTTGIKAVTDAHGYYKLSIPVKGNAPHVRIEYSKPGYQGTSCERSWPSLKQNAGFCDVGFMSVPSARIKEGFMDIPNSRNDLPADPGYHDALQNLKLVLQENDEMNSFLAVQKAHAEIALWYTTEDNQKRILIHTDGTIERFGYPGTPSLAEMGKEYSGLPEFMTSTGHTGNSGYLSRWAAISEQAQKDFHTTGSNVKAIIFPGDSRVLVAPASGKPRIYDMDSNDPTERPAFEQLYGKLPACVPEPSHHAASATTPQLAITQNPAITPSPATTQRPATTPPPADTMPHARDTFAGQFHVSLRAAAPLKDLPIDKDKVLWVVDGISKPSGWDWRDSLRGAAIASEDVLTGEQAIRIFGKAGANGVVAILTASGQNPLFQLSQLPGSSAMLYVLDGRVIDFSDAERLDISTIQSVNVLKDEAAKVIFGEKAANGAVVITTKNVVIPQITLQARDANGNTIPSHADTLK